MGTIETSSRRTFLQTSATVAGASLLPASALAGASGRQDDVLKVALIGCGGRGSGAITQALRTAGNVRLVAVADAFRDRLDGCLAEVSQNVPEERIDVPEERKFVGFDAYEKAMAEDVDVVVLTTPPGFRPMHFEHAIAKGKHVFMEKPVAVDGPGIRKVLAAGEEAKRKNLKVGVGLQRHHSAATANGSLCQAASRPGPFFSLAQSSSDDATSRPSRMMSTNRACGKRRPSSGRRRTKSAVFSPPSCLEESPAKPS